VFTDSVLELVRLIQAGLGLFGMFDLSPEENGLLCDVTVEAVQRWIDEIGEPICKLEVCYGPLQTPPADCFSSRQSA
jgi:hypothetical protein